MKKIYLAGGCFWGVEHYFSLIKGVKDTSVGYANSNIEYPTYEDVCKGRSDASECVEVIYDDSIISLVEILNYYCDIVDLESINKQGNDEGIQYRSGVYVLNEEDYQVVNDYFSNFKDIDVKVEIMNLKNFYQAEEYHQDYLYKNPSGYCHINPLKFQELKKKFDS